MATGTTKRPSTNYKNVYYYYYDASNHAVTTHSSNGVYYSASEINISRTGLEPIGCLIREWSGLSASITPYITTAGKLGFLSDVSQTLSNVTLVVVYRES